MFPGMMAGITGMMGGGVEEIPFTVSISTAYTETGSTIRTQKNTDTANITTALGGPFTYIWSWGTTNGFGNPIVAGNTTSVATFTQTYSQTNPEQYSYTGEASVTVTHTATGRTASASYTHSFMTNQNG